MIELKKCPFCGGEAELEEYQTENGTDWKASCRNGGICDVLPSTWWYGTMDEAIEAWNRRANDGA